jgi:hypothetical protein
LIPSGPIVSILINIFTLRLLIRYILTIISVSIGLPIFNFPSRRRGIRIYSIIKYRSLLIPLTIKRLSIVLILIRGIYTFRKRLLPSIIGYPVSRYTS